MIICRGQQFHSHNQEQRCSFIIVSLRPLLHSNFNIVVEAAKKPQKPREKYFTSAFFSLPLQFLRDLPLQQC